MNIYLIIKIIGLVYLLKLYFKNNKYRPFLHLIFVYFIFFISDIWRLVEYIYNFPVEIILLMHKVVIVFDVFALFMVSIISWKMLNKDK